jgi:hypothetical protein
MLKSFAQFISEKYTNLGNKANLKNREFFVVYSGRFQPFHVNHNNVFEWVKSNFGKKNSFIITSNRKEAGKSPFTIQEKVKIITSMFPISKDQVKFGVMPYKPFTWDRKFIGSYSDDAVYISIIGEKDEDRMLEEGYFEEYSSNKELKGWREKGYYVIAPMQTIKFEGKIISGTLVRDVLGGDDEDKAKRLFISLYGKMNKDIFALMREKIGQ